MKILGNLLTSWGWQVGLCCRRSMRQRRASRLAARALKGMRPAILEERDTHERDK